MSEHEAANDILMLWLKTFCVAGLLLAGCALAIAFLGRVRT